MSIGQVMVANGNSQKTIKLVAAAARSKGDPAIISTGNATEGVNNDASLADNTNIYRVVVAAQSAASGAVYSAYTEGTVKMTVPSGNYTKGNGVLILDGAVADAGAVAQDASGEATNTHFGIIHTGGTSVTEITVTLFGHAITGTT